MTTIDDQQYMARALRLAHRGLYTTHPNPRVGCILVRDGNIVGEGWHERAGEAHAEVNALRQAGPLARGATAYVTLEPCCHHGRTPPCTDALINAGINRVVAAMQDPNPLVAGKGMGRLGEAGMETVVGVMEAQARGLNPGYLQRMEFGRPFVRCKLAMSLDGRTAMASGESKWITGTEARQDVQRLRARSSAILTGIGTVLADDPSLNVRYDEMGEVEVGGSDLIQPLRIVLDSALKMPVSACMLKQAGSTLVVTASSDQRRKKLVQDAGAEVEELPAGPDRVDLHALMSALARRQINEVLIEAGAVLSGAMLCAGLIDELIVYLAPHLMGNQGRGLFNLPDLGQMAQRVPLHIQDIRAVGDDWRITCKVGESAG